MALVAVPPVPEQGAETPEVDTSLAFALAQEYADHGPHPEYRNFAQLAIYHLSNSPLSIGRKDEALPMTGYNTFEFIDDAYNGTGGFATGSYLDPYEGEIPTSSVANTSVSPTEKLLRRQRLTDYDNFVRTLCDTPWSYIIQSRDLIRRAPDENTPAAKLLPDFWENVDGTGTDITAFWEIPWREASKFGTGFVLVDRPSVDIENLAADEAEDNQPYAYPIPTQNVVHWKFDDDGELDGIVIVEGGDPWNSNVAPSLRIWTKASWAIFDPITERDKNGNISKVSYGEPSRSGKNPVGEVPVVAVFRNRPRFGCLMGDSIMFQVSLIAKTIYNIDSEIREIERACAFPMLALPMDDPSKVNEVRLVAGGTVAYSKDGHPPQFIEPMLDTIQRLSERRQKKLEQAYAMAHLAATTGYVQTTSGFHQEAVFDDSNRHIGMCAQSLAAAEKRLARLFLLWKGIPDEQITGTINISYPVDFGIRDKQAAADRAALLLDLALGRKFNELALTDLVTTMFPRVDDDQVKAIVAEAATALEQNTDQIKQNRATASQTIRRFVDRGAWQGQPTPGA